MFDIRLVYNNKEYKSDIEFVKDISSVLDQYEDVKKQWIDSHPLTKDAIYQMSVERGIDLELHPDKRKSIIESVQTETEQEANRQKWKFARENWTDASNPPKDYRWCVALTSDCWLRVCFYHPDKHYWSGRGFDSREINGMRSYDDQERVTHYIPIVYDRLQGRIVNGISYVNFPNHRFKTDENGNETVEIMDFDKCYFRTRHHLQKDSYIGDYPLSDGCLETSAGFLKRYETYEEVVEIYLQKADEKDTIFYAEEKERKLKAEQEREAKRKAQEEKKRLEHERREREIQEFEEREAAERRRKQREIEERFEQQRLTEISKRLQDPDGNDPVFGMYKDVYQKAVDSGMTANEAAKFVECMITIGEGRATGRTTKIFNSIISDFFEKPVGTPIDVQDHEGGSDKYLIKRVKEFLCTGDALKYTIVKEGGHYVLRRWEQTKKEKSAEFIREMTRKYNLS